MTSTQIPSLGRMLLVLLIAGGVAFGQTDSQAGRQLIPIKNELTSITDRYLQLREPAGFYATENIAIVKQMQERCNAAEDYYTWKLTPTEASQALDDMVAIHMLMACASAIIDDETAFELHKEIACSRVRQYRGFEQGRCHDTVNSLIENHPIRPDLSLLQEYKRLSGLYAESRNVRLKLDLKMNRSTTLVPLKEFVIEALRDPGGTSVRDDARLFAEATRQRLSEPIVKNWFFNLYQAQAAARRLTLDLPDYFGVNRANVEKAEFETMVMAEFANEREVTLPVAIPDGRYYVYRLGQRAADPEPNLIVDRSKGRIPTGFLLKMQESGTFIDVVVQYGQEPVKAFSLGSLRPRFEILNFSLGTEKQTRNLEGSFGGRMFQKFGPNLALQTQGQFEFRTYRDQLDLDRIFLSMAGQPLAPGEQRGLADYGSREFQLDVGPVIRFGPMQFAVMESLRYVKRDGFDQGGVVGQFFFNAGYLFKHGQIGFFGTRANLDQPVVKSVQFSQVFFEETYLKVADQVGLNFQIAVPTPVSGYLEGTVGYLNTTATEGAVGGTLRYVRPIPRLGKKLAWTAEVGYNEGLIRSSENSLRVGFGLRFGNWSQPVNSGFAKESGPVPVIVPGVRYETLTRTVRRGNSKPVANAGPDLKNVDPGAAVTLDGRGSFDPDSDPIAYKWIQVSGPAATLSSSSIATPSFNAGSFGDTYVFKLIVCDTFGTSLCSDDPNSTACPGTGSATDACVSVNIRKAPQIVTLSAAPGDIDAGQSSTLSWTTTDADHATLEPGFSEVPISGSRVVSPLSTTKYLLTAYSGTFSVSREITVNVRTPQVRSFTVDATGLCASQCTTLRWSTSSAVRVVISPDIGEVPPGDGSRQICPDRTTDYTITVFGAGTTLAATATVRATVKPVPRIIDFSADRTRIRAGERVVLSWKTEGGDTVTLTPPLQTVNANGSAQVAPTATQRYDLVVKNACSEVTQSITIYMDAPPPEIISFTASPMLIQPGRTTTLAWNTRNAERVIITGLKDPPPTLPLSGSLQQRVDITTTFTLTAINSAGATVLASITVAVDSSLPQIIGFTVDRSLIRQGETVNLTWDTRYADRVVITNVKNSPPTLPVSGSLQQTLDRTTTFTITAYGKSGAVSAHVTVEVKQTLPVILSFKATPPEIWLGDSSVISWATQSGARWVLKFPATGGELEVGANDSLVVNPLVTTSYILVGYNAVGEFTSETIVLKVK